MSDDDEVFEILSVGCGVTIQDGGRTGWKRFGIPPGGAMDRHALEIANRLAGNIPFAPALEFLMHGGKLRALRDIRIALAGAKNADRLPSWKSEVMPAGSDLTIQPGEHGLWTILAIEGGVDAPELFGSVSTYPRGQIGKDLVVGDKIKTGKARAAFPASKWPYGRWIAPELRMSYLEPRSFGAHRGPQWDLFSVDARARFFSSEWTVSPRSDRTGYRLDGARLDDPMPELQSEPVLTGSIQIPPGGEPIVVMRDGPTVGGYPKLAIVDETHLDSFAQATPGAKFRFHEL